MFLLTGWFCSSKLFVPEIRSSCSDGTLSYGSCTLHCVDFLLNFALDGYTYHIRGTTLLKDWYLDEPCKITISVMTNDDGAYFSISVYLLRDYCIAFDVTGNRIGFADNLVYDE